MTAREGFVDFRGHKTWYRISGDLSSGKTPLLALHGGPGGASDLFEPLEELDRPVVRYDQHGCGRSDRPGDPSLWTVATYVEEVAAVRAQLGLDRVHLLGHSWGCMLALEYLFTKPSGVKSLILASAVASTKLWCDEAERLRASMPRHLVDAMKRCEASHKPKEPRPKAKPALTGDAIEKNARMMSKVMPILMSDTMGRIASSISRVPFLRAPAYELLGAQFGKRYGSRAKPTPIQLAKMFAGMNRGIYQTMWGPSEFFATGTLKDWDPTSRLHEIDVPTLLISGRYDESTPAQNEILRDGIAGSRWVVLENSAHCGPVEEPDAFRNAVSTFVADVEAV